MTGTTALENTLARLKRVTAPSGTSILNNRLCNMGLGLQPVPTDGMCQYHAIAVMLQQGGISGEDASSVKGRVLTWLRENGDRELANGTTLSSFMEGHHGSWEAMCTEMERREYWGNHLTLVGAATVYDVSISVVTSSRVADDGVLVVEPMSNRAADHSIVIAHHAEVHYDATVAIEAK